MLWSFTAPALIGGCLATSQPSPDPEDRSENTESVASALAGTCASTTALAATRQRQAENLYFYMVGDLTKAPTDATLRTHANLIMAEMPYWLNYPGVNGYMAAPRKLNTVTTICGVPATLYRWDCVKAATWLADPNRCTTGTCAPVACSNIKNRAGTLTGLQMLTNLSDRAEIVYPNSRPFLHVDNGTYIEFDPSTARASAILTGTNGASAAGVYTNDNTTTTIRKWPTTSTACMLGAGCPKIGQPCSPANMAIGATTDKTIATFRSGATTFTKCW
jgi:hypothetical protein